jgi:hypothetical protein
MRDERMKMKRNVVITFPHGAYCRDETYRMARLHLLLAAPGLAQALAKTRIWFWRDM